MNWVSSIIVALLAGVAGLFLTGLIANACVSWYHIPSREGASGFFVIFTAVGGGVAGFFLGLITARLVAANYGAGFTKELGAALGLELVVAGIAVLLCRFLADVPPKIDGRPLNLEVEFRFPTGPKTNEPPTAVGEWKVWLGSLAGHTQRKADSGEIKTKGVRIEEGRWIVPAEVSLFTERGKRSVSLQKDQKDVAGFLVPLPARPDTSFQEWSEWLPRQSADGSAWPADKMSYRFRVQKEPLPRAYADIAAEEAAKQEAVFAAIPGDAPITELFPYLSKNPQKDRALASILGRPNLVKELEPIIVGDNAEFAGEALRLIASHPQLTAEFIGPVKAVGRDIAARIGKFNGTTVEADPSFEGAADASIRFHGWMEAVRALRSKAGGDFVPELKSILELSRIRRDSHAMQVDICRVASYYLHEWAGIAPLPGDPKPR